MHLFPPASELHFLIGKEIGQICLDPWSVQIRFVDEGQITIEGRFEHLDARGQAHEHHAGEDRDTGPLYMCELLQERISELEAEPLRLTLKFSNGASLRIHTDEGPHENGNIATALGLIVF